MRTTRMLTNCAGQGGQMSGQPARMTFTAFGEPLGDALASCPRYGYCGAWGYQTDSLTGATGLPAAMHVGARWYDPTAGRFLARDPIGVFGGLNVYAYANDSPPASVDPAGLWSYIEIGVATSVRSTLQSTVAFRVAGATAWLVGHPSGVIARTGPGWAPRFVFRIPIPYPERVPELWDPSTVNCVITAARAVCRGWGLP